MVFPRYRVFYSGGWETPLLAREGFPFPPSPPSRPHPAVYRRCPAPRYPLLQSKRKEARARFRGINRAETRRPFPVLTVPRQDCRRENPSGDSLSFGEGKRRERRLPDAKATGEACFRNTRAGKGWGAGGSPRIFLFHSIIRMTVAGTPPTMDEGGTSRLTTAPAAMTALSPTVTPGSRIAPAPIQTLRPMVTGARL